jgi:hypothetical protein
LFSFFPSLRWELLPRASLSYPTIRQLKIGYVTRVSSPTDFDVDGYRLVFNSKSTLNSESARHGLFDEQALNPFLGDRASVWGKRQKKSHTISVRQIVLRRAEPREVSGFALIQQVTPYNSSTISGAVLVQADGYPILVSSKTATTFAPPLTSLSGIHSNMWIAFHGQQQLNGIVTAGKIELQQNVVSHNEDRLRKKSEYDPAAVDPDAGEDPSRNIFWEWIRKRFHRTPMKQCKRASTESAPALCQSSSAICPTPIRPRFTFRFQLVDVKNWSDAMTLPSGIVLVPRRAIERLQNDSQVATLLADNIASALEKQTPSPPLHSSEVAVAAVVVPLVLVPAVLALGSASAAAQRHAIEQSGRVSLFLMHEAGYDINEAPRTWWLLSSKKDIPEASLPERATYLYQTLGTTWPSAAATGDSTSSSRAETESVP